MFKSLRVTFVPLAALLFTPLWLAVPTFSRADAPRPPTDPNKVINCADFWVDTKGQNIPCQEYTDPGFPTTVNGSELRIFHYADGWKNETARRELMAAVSTVSQTAVDYFSHYWKVPSIYFYLHNEVSSYKYASAKWKHPDNTESCRVDLYLNIPNDPSKGTREIDPAGAWDHPTWKTLNFLRFEGTPHAYSFELDTALGAAKSTFRAVAHGDLDGDGTQSTFELRGTADGTGARIDPGMIVDAELE